MRLSSERTLIFRSSLSIPTTSLPLSARQVAVTSPTYPVPTTATFMRAPSRCGAKLGRGSALGGDLPPVVQHVGQRPVQIEPRRPPGQPPQLPRVGPRDGGVGL